MPAAQTALVIGGGIAARGARLSHAKAPGPIARRIMRLMLPVMVATMNIEKTMATEQRHTIDWNVPAQEDAKSTCMIVIMRLA